MRCFSLSSLDDLPEPPEKSGEVSEGEEASEEDNGQLSIFDAQENGDGEVITATAEEIVNKATAD